MGRHLGEATTGEEGAPAGKHRSTATSPQHPEVPVQFRFRLHPSPWLSPSLAQSPSFSICNKTTVTPYLVITKVAHFQPIRVCSVPTISSIFDSSSNHTSNIDNSIDDDGDDDNTPTPSPRRRRCALTSSPSTETGRREHPTQPPNHLCPIPPDRDHSFTTPLRFTFLSIFIALWHPSARFEKVL